MEHHRLVGVELLRQEWAWLQTSTTPDNTPEEDEPLDHCTAGEVRDPDWENDPKHCSLTRKKAGKKQEREGENETEKSIARKTRP